jgi:ribokinase
VINPAPAGLLPPELLRGAILTPNQGELGRLVPGASSERAAVSRLLDCGARALVVTRGRHGASIFAPGQPPVTIGAPSVDVVDTVGAGDAFNGALAWSLACGAPLAAAVTAAAAAGAAACTGTGARDALPTPAVLAALLGQHAFAAACSSPEGGRHER